MRPLIPIIPKANAFVYESGSIMKSVPSRGIAGSKMNYAESVGQFQPRVAATLGPAPQRIITLKALAKWLRRDLENSFRVRASSMAGTGIPGLLQPWAEIGQRFQRNSFSTRRYCAWVLTS